MIINNNLATNFKGISFPGDLSGPGDCQWGGLWVKILNMLIIPAVDIRAGKCVRLRQGLLSEEPVFSADPEAMGLKWQAAGAKWLHVVDLDGAFTSQPRNLEVIGRLRRALTIPM